MGPGGKVCLAGRGAGIIPYGPARSRPWTSRRDTARRERPAHTLRKTMLPPTAKPYLVRAIYDWCVDEGHTPYLLVAATYPGVRFPDGYAREGRLTLNIAPKAVERLELGPDRIRFLARFAGQVHGVEVPVAAVIAVFAAENHDGVVFGEPPAPAAALADADASEAAPTAGKARGKAEEQPEEAAGGKPDEEPGGKPGGPRLRLVK